MTVRVPLPPEPLSSGHAVDGFECGEGSLDDWLKKRAWVRGIALQPMTLMMTLATVRAVLAEPD
jgi:hypothetical protein